MKNLFLFLLLSFVLFSCNKEDDLSPSPDVYTPPVEKIKGSVVGQVIGESGNGIENVIVQVGTHLQKTGPGGYFRLRNITLDANGTFIQAHQPGFFQASKRFFPKPGATNYTTLILMRKEFDGEVSATAGGKIDAAGWGGEVTLPANGIVTATGAPYTGTVKVAARYLSSSSIGNETSPLLPGNQQGITLSKEVVVLANYGAMAAELISSDGAPLNLAPGSKAELRIPLYSNLLNHAPAEIPLWYFDETTGHWREEGKAIKQGNEYVGEVSHFSFWSWNIPLPFVNVEGRLVDPNGNPLSNTQISFRVPLTSVPLVISGNGFTDDNGNFSGPVPANTEMLLHAYDLCGQGTFSTLIGALTNDTDLGEIETPANLLGFTKISGTLINCDGNPVESGIVRVGNNPFSNNHYNYAYTDSDGHFVFSFAHCAGDNIEQVKVTAFDLEAESQGPEQYVNVTIAPEINLGVVSACVSDITEYIHLNVNGQERTFLYPYSFGGNQPGTILTVGGAAADSSYALRFTFPASGIGSYTNEGVRYWSNDFFPDFMVAVCGPSCSNLTINVTEFGSAPGEYVRGTFNGTIDYDDAAQQLVGSMPVTGNFSFKR